MQKIIWPVLIVTAVLSVAILIGFRSASKPVANIAPAVAPSSASAEREPSSFASDSSVASSPNSAPQAAASPQPTTPTTLSPASAPGSLQRIQEEIAAAAESSTPESLTALVSYASDDNADIRTTALNALIRRDDATAAPFLRAAAKKTDSSAVAIAMLQTADYLELPAATLHAIAAMPKPLKTDSHPNQRPGSPKPATPPSEDKP